MTKVMKVTELLILILIIKLINGLNLCKVYNLPLSLLSGGNGKTYLYECQTYFTAKLENQVFVMNCNVKNSARRKKSKNVTEELSSLSTTISNTITQLTLKNCPLEYVTLLVMMYPALVGNITTITFEPSKRDKITITSTFGNIY
jgi:hypothetical protein